MSKPDDYIGINWHTATPYAYVGKMHWNIKENGITETNISKLLKITEEFAEKIKDEKSDLAVFKEKNASARKVLELALDKFVWSKAANNINVGPENLFVLAGEIKNFLSQGGKHGRQRLQMRLDMINTLSSNGTRKAKKS